VRIVVGIRLLISHSALNLASEEAASTLLAQAASTRATARNCLLRETSPMLGLRPIYF
jgi:hypothetical protein